MKRNENLVLSGKLQVGLKTAKIVPHFNGRIIPSYGDISTPGQFGPTGHDTSVLVPKCPRHWLRYQIAGPKRLRSKVSAYQSYTA